MSSSRSLLRRFRHILLSGLSAAGLGGLLAELPADTIVSLPPPQPTGVAPAAVPPAHPIQVIDLAAAKALALQKQPAIAAAQASLAAAHARKKAIDDLRVPTCLQRDLPIRRQQAGLGLVAGESALKLAEIYTIYAVEYCYVSYLYARTQMQFIDESERALADFRKRAQATIESDKKKDNDTDKGVVKEGVAETFVRKDLGEQWTLTQTDSLLESLAARRKEAESGALRALSALREAMGVPNDCHLVPAHDRLFDVDAHLDCRKLVELALARRPEIVQASIGVEVSDLEVSAQQQRRCALRVNTFAAGTDIHAIVLPPAQTDDTYRPGAVAPEMPTLLAGKACDRVNMASIYKGRAGSVLEKVRQLIQLQVEQAYLRYCEAREKVIRYEKAADLALKSQKYTGMLFAYEKGTTNMGELLIAGQLAADTRARAYQSRYELLLALIALERHTVGGYCAGLETAPQIPPPPPSGVSEEERKRIEKELKLQR